MNVLRAHDIPWARPSTVTDEKAPAERPAVEVCADELVEDRQHAALLREEVAGHGVRVVTIAPGAVETELLSHTADEVANLLPLQTVWLA
ncbi:hypothetical protein [Streptomyces sp. NPDC008001]|uniref:hypothetical protein n=1 Tax=Streptomyces sp. NPDC008001 TaxID=3364804 RepID=UPI0036E6CBB9